VTRLATILDQIGSVLLPEFQRGHVWNVIRSADSRAIKDVYVRAKSEANYTVSCFISMLSIYGGLGNVQRLLTSTKVASGFAAAYKRGRLDLTVEALVIQSKFACLFTGEELDIVRQRLDQLGYR
jgi:hypothetical protein